MKVIVDLHAVQGSQNGNDHSGIRDGYQEWGDSYIQDTVAVIDFLAKRFSKFSTLIRSTINFISYLYFWTKWFEKYYLIVIGAIDTTQIESNTDQLWMLPLFRYANNPSLGAIELMNELVALGVNLDNLEKYFQAVYDAVRKYTSNTYVILSNWLEPIDPKELLSFGGKLNCVVINVHYYNIYSDMFSNMNV